MTAVPPATPVNTPDEMSMVATLVVLLLHVPPAAASLSVIVEPAQTVVGPVGAVATELTVTTFVAEQPSESEYEIVLVPSEIPVILPDPSTETWPLLLLHVPPVVGSDSVPEEPMQSVPGPVMAKGVGNTVTIVLAVQPAAVV